MKELIKELLDKVPTDDEFFEIKILLEYSDLAEVPAKLNGENKYRHVAAPDKIQTITDFMGDEDRVLVCLDDKVYSLEKLPSGGIILAGYYPIIII